MILLLGGLSAEKSMTDDQILLLERSPLLIPYLVCARELDL